ncbi:MAG: hypothetical protein JXA96_17180 [Sedimentisphaerales bacterium]|nr:hypothetical protein [Sedimentisphaerales bacterium]
MTKEIKFPFEPNEKVKASFRQTAQRKKAIQVMTEAITTIACKIDSPWRIARKEHPELMSIKEVLQYNELTETIDIVVSE